MAAKNQLFGTWLKSNEVNAKKPNMLQFIADKLYMSTQYDARKFRQMYFDSAKDFYHKDLVAHYGCVNAIEFSDDGDLLFSGGDDRRILMWKVDNAVIKEKDCVQAPAAMETVHDSNIFCLAVDSFNKRVLSGSNDHQVITHDFLTGKVINSFVHDSPIFCISMNPSQGLVFVIATDDGQILLFDSRHNELDSVCVARLPAPFHGVMYNPLETSLVATANGKLGIHVWDVRKPLQPIAQCCSEQGMSVRWNETGSRLLCIRNFLPPLLLDFTEPERRLEFDAKAYYIACTMKSCCFAGDNDEYILSGSDDFNVYMWKIPEPWPEPRWVGEEKLVLRGHRSIVNQVRYCPRKQLIASSGVEKIIKLWSPDQMPSSSGNRDVARTEPARLLCSAGPCRRIGHLVSEIDHESVEEDHTMLHFFDSLLRNELSKHRTNSVFDSNTRSSARYRNLIRRKKKYLLNIMSDQKPNFCSLRNIIRTRLRNIISDPMERSSNSSESTSDTSNHSELNQTLAEDIASSHSSSDSRPGKYSPSSRYESSATPSRTVNDDNSRNNSSSSEEDATEIVFRRVNKKYRCYRKKTRQRRTSVVSSEQTCSTGHSETDDDS